MSKVLELDPAGEAPLTDAEYQVAIRAMLEEMERANARMAEDQIEIDRMRAETRAMLSELPRLIAR